MIDECFLNKPTRFWTEVIGADKIGFGHNGLSILHFTQVMLQINLKEDVPKVCVKRGEMLLQSVICVLDRFLHSTFNFLSQTLNSLIRSLIHNYTISDVSTKALMLLACCLKQVQIWSSRLEVRFKNMVYALKRQWNDTSCANILSLKNISLSLFSPFKQVFISFGIFSFL